MFVGPSRIASVNVNRQEDASVNGLDTETPSSLSTRDSAFMKHLLAALVATAFCAVAQAQGTTPASPSAPQASASAPAKSGTTKKAKKKKANKPAGSTSASGASPTK